MSDNSIFFYSIRSFCVISLVTGLMKLTILLCSGPALSVCYIRHLQLSDVYIIISALLPSAVLSNTKLTKSVCMFQHVFHKFISSSFQCNPKVFFRRGSFFNSLSPCFITQRKLHHFSVAPHFKIFQSTPFRLSNCRITSLFTQHSYTIIYNA